MGNALKGAAAAVLMAGLLSAASVSAAPKAKDCWKHWDADLGQYVAIWVSTNASRGHSRHVNDVNLGTTPTAAACQALVLGV